jgi:guanine deaminase
MTVDKFMRRALEISATAKDDPGALPYGAVVVRDGRIIGEGLNWAPGLHDPTSHGEVEAIRDACRRLGTTDLSGATMYTTAEPCSLCVATMILANMAKLVYAADWRDSAELMAGLAEKSPDLRRRYNTVELRDQVARAPESRDMPAERMGQAEAREILEGFAKARSG